MDKLIKKLNIDETYTKAPKQKVFNKVKDNVPHVEDYNFMADLLLLPETKKGFKYLLVRLGSNVLVQKKRSNRAEFLFSF